MLRVVARLVELDLAAVEDADVVVVAAGQPVDGVVGVAALVVRAFVAGLQTAIKADEDRALPGVDHIDVVDGELHVAARHRRLGRDPVGVHGGAARHIGFVRHVRDIDAHAHADARAAARDRRAAVGEGGRLGQILRKQAQHARVAGVVRRDGAADAEHRARRAARHRDCYCACDADARAGRAVAARGACARVARVAGLAGGAGVRRGRLVRGGVLLPGDFLVDALAAAAALVGRLVVLVLVACAGDACLGARAVGRDRFRAECDRVARVDIAVGRGERLVGRDGERERDADAGVPGLGVAARLRAHRAFVRRGELDLAGVVVRGQAIGAERRLRVVVRHRDRDRRRHCRLALAARVGAVRKLVGGRGRELDVLRAADRRSVADVRGRVRHADVDADRRPDTGLAARLLLAARLRRVGDEVLCGQRDVAAVGDGHRGRIGDRRLAVAHAHVDRERTGDAGVDSAHSGGRFRREAVDLVARSDLRYERLHDQAVGGDVRVADERFVGDARDVDRDGDAHAGAGGFRVHRVEALRRAGRRRVSSVLEQIAAARRVQRVVCVILGVVELELAAADVTHEVRLAVLQAADGRAAVRAVVDLVAGMQAGVGAEIDVVGGEVDVALVRGVGDRRVESRAGIRHAAVGHGLCIGVVLRLHRKRAVRDARAVAGGDGQTAEDRGARGRVRHGNAHRARHFHLLRAAVFAARLGGRAVGVAGGLAALGSGAVGGELLVVGGLLVDAAVRIVLVAVVRVAAGHARLGLGLRARRSLGVEGDRPARDHVARRSGDCRVGSDGQREGNADAGLARLGVAGSRDVVAALVRGGDVQRAGIERTRGRVRVGVRRIAGHRDGDHRGDRGLVALRRTFGLVVHRVLRGGADRHGARAGDRSGTGRSKRGVAEQRVGVGLADVQAEHRPDAGRAAVRLLAGPLGGDLDEVLGLDLDRAAAGDRDGRAVGDVRVGMADADVDDERARDAGRAAARAGDRRHAEPAVRGGEDEVERVGRRGSAERERADRARAVGVRRELDRAVVLQHGVVRAPVGELADRLRAGLVVDHRVAVLEAGSAAEQRDLAGRGVHAARGKVECAIVRAHGRLDRYAVRRDGVALAFDVGVVVQVAHADAHGDANVGVVGSVAVVVRDRRTAVGPRLRIGGRGRDHGEAAGGLHRARGVEVGRAVAHHRAHRHRTCERDAVAAARLRVVARELLLRFLAAVAVRGALGRRLRYRRGVVQAVGGNGDAARVRDLCVIIHGGHGFARDDRRADRRAGAAARAVADRDARGRALRRHVEQRAGGVYHGIAGDPGVRVRSDADRRDRRVGVVVGLAGIRRHVGDDLHGRGGLHVELARRSDVARAADFDVGGGEAQDEGELRDAADIQAARRRIDRRVGL